MNVKTIMRAAVGALIAAGVLTACGGTSASDSGAKSGSDTTAKVVVGVAAPVANLLLPFYAQDNGFFEKAGLSTAEVKLVPGPQLPPALAGGAVNISISGAPAPDIAALKSPIKIIGTWALQQGFELLAAPGIKSVADLKGKRVAINGSKAGGLSIMTEHALEEVGLSYSDVNLVVLQDYAAQVAAFSGGQVDAMVAAPPAIQQVMEKRPGTTGLRDFSDMKFPAPGIQVNPEWAGDHKTEITAFLKGLNDALHSWLAEPDKAKATIAKQMNLTAGDPIIDVLYQVTTDTFEKDVQPVTADVQREIFSFVRDTGFPEATDEAASKVIDESYVKSALGS